MIKKTITLLTVVLLSTTLLTGCWNRRELNELGIVVAAAIEKDTESDQYILTAEIVRPAALSKDSGGSSMTKNANELVTAQGATLFEAIRNMSKKFDRQPFFSHTKVLVIDEQVAREGITPVLHVWLNSEEIRPVLWFVISKGVPARRILSELHGIEGIQANYLASIIRDHDLNSETTAVNLLDVNAALGSDTINPIAGVMELSEAPPSSVIETNTGNGIKLLGTAVFKKDKLVGYLNGKESRGLNWIIGKVQSGVIQVPSSKGGLVAIEIKNAEKQIRAEIKDGKYIFNIEVQEEGNIIEKQQRLDLNQLPYLNELNQQQQYVIEEEISQTIDKVQKEYGSDIFGFGKALYDAYPDEWEKVKNDWPTIFPSVEYTVKVDTKIRRLGLMQKPILPKPGPEPEIGSKSRPYDFLKTDE
ncbi:Ger(x)C family spore germination protein [Anaerosinus massiliensis]|uniref:Ger(x)C family spore germination protein n=1 Tax=Massilibacillus massiliensis TaxID=1806837 RepID=UPI000A4F38F9|nr:Ger(x)C family spore germination protein [Massilibacillus massiliensis]